jgi:16S rRNA (adenine1518-N6/adenine1519-N6)-dimethyltransferase
VRTAFNQRRKTLGNALKQLPELKAPPPAEFAGKRAEQLGVADFIALTCAIAGY